MTTNLADRVEGLDGPCRETDREYLWRRLVHHQGNGLSVAEAQRQARADATCTPHFDRAALNRIKEK